MSKKSRRRNKAILGLGAALLGAKFLGGKTDAAKMVTSGGGGKDAAKMVTKKPVKVIAKAKPTKVIPGNISDKVPLNKSNPFKMFGVKEMPSADNISKFKAANKRQIERRSGNFFDNLKSKMASAAETRAAKKVAFNEKIAANNAKVSKVGNYFKKGTMVKARGGGMARTKPTKLS
ncbi:hypothetical protein KJN74_03835 [Candidatus Bathyarchaeota archaeon]|nr:hypothetical protein [Candidatus Bathyarchaeota archaeon]